MPIPLAIRMPKADGFILYDLQVPIVNKKGDLLAAPSSWMPGSSPGMTISESSRTPRRGPARIAFHAGAVAHQGEVAAFATHLAFVAFCLCFGAAFGF